MSNTTSNSVPNSDSISAFPHSAHTPNQSLNRSHGLSILEENTTNQDAELLDSAIVLMSTRLHIPNRHLMTTRPKNGIFKPTVFVAHKEPDSVEEALQLDHWKQAITNEFLALLRNNTWSLVPLPQGRKAIGCKWVFKVKEILDGTISKYKVRLVAKGFHQVVRFDFNVTFSPVVKPITIQVVLTTVLTRGWTIRQLDINNAFLNGDLQEEVYMEQPTGFKDPKAPQLVCKLHKSPYVLNKPQWPGLRSCTMLLLVLVFQSAKSNQ